MAEVEYQREGNELRKLQKEVNRIDSMRQDYLLKKNENELVKSELDLLEPEAVIYKLIGPALIRQALPESKVNVEKRLEFINGEIERLVKHREEFLKRVEEQSAKVAKMQAELQPAGPPPPPAN